MLVVWSPWGVGCFALGVDRIWGGGVGGGFGWVLGGGGLVFVFFSFCSHATFPSF